MVAKLIAKMLINKIKQVLTTKVLKNVNCSISFLLCNTFECY